MRTLILGLDAFDPTTFERLAADGRLPHLSRLAETGDYARLAVTAPPQSEVSWTSIATGLDPGGHGIFDFVHRDPATYRLGVSLLPTERGLGGTRFVPPHRAPTLFDHAAEQGYPATSLWWPATFPAQPGSPVRTLPGLGTPDIRGQLGVGTLLTTAELPEHDERKTRTVHLERKGADRYLAELPGPARKTRDGERPATLELALEYRAGGARLTIGDAGADLALGRWSGFLQLTFKLGWLSRVHCLTRAVLTALEPEVQLYLLPLQLHPLHAPWRYGSPGDFVKDVWRKDGPFFTLGWPQDTTALEEGCIDDEQFLQLCDEISTAREELLLRQLAGFEEGVIGCVLDSLDRVQHMFRRDAPQVVDRWYERLDAFVGRVNAKLDRPDRPPARLIVLSDHGFAPFTHKVSLNRWLVEHGALVTRDGDGGAPSGDLSDARWEATEAYAVGLNSLYLNVAGRERDGTVPPDEQANRREALAEALAAWRGPDGQPVVTAVRRAEEVFSGPLAEHGPDLVVGYGPGYRASRETGLGGWGAQAIERNEDHWGADHCIDAEHVPGVLFCSDGLDDAPRPSFREVPGLAVGAAPDDGGSGGSSDGTPIGVAGEDADRLAERLKGLGYL